MVLPQDGPSWPPRLYYSRFTVTTNATNTVVVALALHGSSASHGELPQPQRPPQWHLNCLRGSLLLITGPNFGNISATQILQPPLLTVGSYGPRSVNAQAILQGKHGQHEVVSDGLEAATLACLGNLFLLEIVLNAMRRPQT